MLWHRSWAAGWPLCARVEGRRAPGAVGRGGVGTCRICQGAGYTRADVPVGHPQFGKPLPCVCKRAAWEERSRLRQVEHSNLGTLQDKGFRSFDVRVPGVREAFQAAVSYARRPVGWLLLVGGERLRENPPRGRRW